MEDERLMAMFKFDEGDLMANRNGRLSPKQLAVVQDLDRFGRNFVLGLSIVVGIIAIIPIVIIIISILPCIQNFCADWPPSLKIFLGVMALIWTPIWGIIAIRMFTHNLSHSLDVQVKMVEGEVNIVAVESRNASTHSLHTSYELRIGGMSFDVEGDLANIMMQGDRYAVYYLPEMNQIQAVEKI